MPKGHEGLLAGATAGCLVGLALFARSHSMAWQMYGGLMLLLSAAILVATALAQAHATTLVRRFLDPDRGGVPVFHGRFALHARVRPRRRLG